MRGDVQRPQEALVGWAAWLSAGFNAAFAVLLYGFARLYVPAAPLPWWIPWVAAGSAFESTLAQMAVESWRLPRLLRLAEGIGILAGVYLAAGGGALVPGPTLAEWGATEGAASAFALLLTGWTWSSAAVMGARLASLGSRPAYDTGLRRLRAPAYVERRLFASLVAATLLAAGAVESFPERLFAHSAASLRLTLVAAVALLLASGFSLLGVVALLRAQTAWAAAGIWVSGRLPGQWLRGVGYTVAACVGLALLLPGGWALFSFDGLLERGSLAIAGLLQSVTAGFFTRLMMRGSSVDLPRGGGGRRGTGVEVGPGSAGDDPFLAVQALGAVILLGALALGAMYILGKVLAAVGKEEWLRLPSLREVPVRLFLWLQSAMERLARLFRRGLSAVKRRAGALWRALTEPPAERPVQAPPEAQAPSAPALFVRFLFSRLLQTAARQGLPRRRAETPAEYARRLKGEVEGVSAPLDHLVEAYAQARYDRRPLPEAIKGPAQAAWRRVVEALKAHRGK